MRSVSQANNEIVENITHLSAASQEITASAAESSDISVQNLNNSEEAQRLLNDILMTSEKLEKYTNTSAE